MSSASLESMCWFTVRISKRKVSENWLISFVPFVQPPQKFHLTYCWSVCWLLFAAAQDGHALLLYPFTSQKRLPGPHCSAIEVRGRRCCRGERGQRRPFYEMGRSWANGVATTHPQNRFVAKCSSMTTLSFWYLVFSTNAISTRGSLVRGA